MHDLENLLREELQRETQKVQPGLLRPLQVPTRRPSWRPRLLPFTAAAAVIAVITAAALVAGLTAADKPAVRKPAVSGSAPASLPRFYVTTSSSPGGRGIQAVVRASASGQVTGTVRVPSALPVEWADSGGTFVTAAADDRSFIIGVQGGQAPTKIGLDLRLFRFAISAAGKPGHLTELAPAPMRNETTEGIALSPDGKLLAVSLMRDSPPDAGGAIQVLDLATGATRTWTAPAHSVYIPGPPSWADGSRVIAFTWLRSTQSGLMSAPRGIRLLDTAAPGDNLVAGTVIVPRGVVAAGSLVSALITPDGRDVIVVTWRDLTPQASTHTVIVQFAELQACNGRKSGYRCWPGILRCLPVLADQPGEPGPALDPGGRD